MKKRLLTGAVCLSLAGMTMLTACSGKESAKKGEVELEILLADDTLEGGEGYFRFQWIRSVSYGD